MGRALVTLHNDADRARAIDWIHKAPRGTAVEFKANRRSREQNSRMWAMLTEISRQLLWHGQRYTAEDWKDYMMHALKRERWMPAEEGGMVPIGRSTSSLTKDEHSELTALMEAFAARNGVTFKYEEEAA